MTILMNPLDVIEAQLDVLDQAISDGLIGTLDVPQWAPPAIGLPLDRERLIRLLGRIEVTIEKVGEAKQYVVEAQAAVSRRREIARLYAVTGA